MPNSTRRDVKNHDAAANLATVVAAKKKEKDNAWYDYEVYHAYVCQPKRSFGLVRHIAFQFKGEIQETVPTILGEPEDVTFELGRYNGRIGELVEQMLANNARQVGAIHRVFLLSAPDALETVKLGGTIKIDKRDKNGRPIPFTYGGNRYVKLAELLRVAVLPQSERVTSQLK